MYEDYITYRNGGYIEFQGPSDVDKPTEGFTTGLWVETGTGNVYAYDFTTGWTLWLCLKDDSIQPAASASTLSASPRMLGSTGLRRAAAPDAEPEIENEPEAAEEPVEELAEEEPAEEEPAIEQEPEEPAVEEPEEPAAEEPAEQPSEDEQR